MFTRVLYRMWLGVIDVKWSLLICAVLFLSLVAVVGFRSVVGPRGDTNGSYTVDPNGDCADRIVYTRLDNSTEALHRAYLCFAPGITNQSEASYVSVMQGADVPLATQVIREFDYRTPDGRHIVDYIVIQADGVTPSNWAVFVDVTGLVVGIQ